MSTQSCTQDQPATSQPGTRRAPRPHRGQPSWYRIAAIAIGAVAAAALIVLAATGPATQAALASYLAHGNNQMAG